MKRLDLTHCWAVSALCLGAQAAGIAAPADPSPGPSTRCLRDAPSFAVGGIGITGALSKQEEALQTILRRPDASAVLLALQEDPHTTTAGHLYALLGLRRLETRPPSPAGDSEEARKAFGAKVRQYFSTYRAATGQVEVIRGCIIGTQPIAELAKAIDEGQVHLSLGPRRDPQPRGGGAGSADPPAR